ncbi:PAS domain-containing sensor histidine kinase [Melioribacter sp. OK-6-Me]|uniref:PAS domain-containing sensor histidine kinase n=1 Tax=unclassified Melioribacter TaxID=2627329 RepID=UPI003ED93B19
MEKKINNNLTIFLKKRPFKIATRYFLVSSTFTVISILLTFTIETDAYTLKIAAITQAVAYILLTALILYYLLQYDTKQILQQNEELIEQEKRWNYAFEGAGDGVWDWNLKTNEVYFSKNWKTMLGYKEDEIKNYYTEWESRLHPDDKEFVLKKLNDYLAGKSEMYSVESRLRTKDGSYKWILDRGKIFEWDSDGKPLRMIGTHTDISELKKLKEEKEYLLNQLQLEFERMPIGMILLNSDFTVKDWNPSAENIFGYKKEDIINKKIHDFITLPENRSAIENQINSLIKQNDTLQSTEINVTKNGKQIICEWYNTPLYDHSRKFKGLMSMVIDVTEVKKQEEEVSRNKELLNRILDTSPVGIISVNQDGIITFANEAAHDILSFDKENLINKCCHSIEFNFYTAEGELLAEIEYPFNIVKRRGEIIRDKLYGYKSAEGFKILSVNSTPLRSHHDKFEGVVCTIEDITDHYKIENALKESEKKFRILFMNNPHPMWIYDVDTMKFIEVNDAAIFHYGYSKEEFLSMKLTDIRPEEDIPYLIRSVREDTEITQRHRGWRHRKKDGTIIYVEISSHALPHTLGGNYRLVTAIDITEQYLAEKALQENEEKFRILTETTSSAIFIYQDNKFVYLNPYTEIITGYSKDELMEMEVWNLIHPDFRDEVMKIGIARLEGKAVPNRYSFKIITKDGTERWIELSAGTILYKNKPAAIGTAFDITVMKNAETILNESRERYRQLVLHMQTLRESERAAIAREMHDELGQLLTSLKMNLSIIKRDIVEKKIQDINTIITELDSMSGVIDRAVAGVRKMITELRPEVLDKLGLIPAIEWLVENFKKTTKIDCSYKFSDESIQLDSDKELVIFRIIQEALTNISRHSKATKVSVSLTKKEGSIHLIIKDNGVGFDNKMLADKKTFGLMGMQERASSIGATFEIESKKGQGTVIKLVL